MEGVKRLLERWVSFIPAFNISSAASRREIASAFVAVPIRRSGRRTLIQIPAEIYLLIFEQIWSNYPSEADEELKRTMLAASRVCRFFRSACKCYVFRAITLPYDWPHYLRKSGRGQEWLTLIHSEDSNARHCAQFVRYLIVRARKPNFYTEDDRNLTLVQRVRAFFARREMERIPSEDICRSSVTSFTHLQVCFLLAFPISMPLLAALATLPQLVLLSISAAPCVRGLPFHLTDIRGSGLHSFTVVNCIGLTQDWIAVMLQLVDRRKLTSLETDHPSILGGVLDDTSEPSSIVELSVRSIPATHEYFHGQDRSAVYLRWLSQCPALIRLTMYEPAITTSIPATVCPALRSLSCSAALASRFLHSARPILILNCHRVPEAHLNALRTLTFAIIQTTSFSSRPRNVTLPLKFLNYITEGVVLIIPNVTINMGQAFLSSLVQGGWLSSLHRDRIAILCDTLQLTFDDPITVPFRFAQDVHTGLFFRGLDLVGQKWLLDHDIWGEVFPETTSLVIDSFLTWRKASGAGQWVPSVTDVSRLATFIEGPVLGEARDLDDCLAKALAPLRLHPAVMRKRGLRSL